MAKRRWWDREILEVVSTEFRDRSIEYYVRFHICLKIWAINIRICVHSGMLSSQASAASTESRQESELLLKTETALRTLFIDMNLL